MGLLEMLGLAKPSDEQRTEKALRLLAKGDYEKAKKALNFETQKANFYLLMAIENAHKAERMMSAKTVMFDVMVTLQMVIKSCEHAVEDSTASGIPDRRLVSMVVTLLETVFPETQSSNLVSGEETRASAKTMAAKLRALG